MTKTKENLHFINQKQFTLRIALLTGFGGLAIVSGILMSTVTSNLASRFMREALRHRLHDAISIAASQINVELHQQLQSRADEESAAYQTLQEQLRTFRNRGTAIRYVYTMRQLPDGRLVFVVDAEENEEQLSHIGDVYTGMTPALLAALSAPPGPEKAYVETALSSDKWGTWLSAHAPLYTPDGRLDGVLGMDISAANVLAHDRQYQWLVWLISAFVTMVIFAMGVVFAQRIRRPLAQLEAEMGKVRQFEIESAVVVHSRIREIHSMAVQLDNMKSGLRSFRKYVPSDLVRQLMTLGIEAELGGVTQELTIFFSDITNFTSVSEKLAPERLVRYLGEYLNAVTSDLLHHDATVDKYIGDGIMAFWGAPKKMVDHAVKTCLAALACQQTIDALNRRWQAEGREVTFHTRIGINTGNVIVGNMGSDQRMSYTIIGDAVNLASRVEGANKFYGTRILISEGTYAHVKDHFAVRLVDTVIVIGKSTPICLYELLATVQEVTGEQRQLAEWYTEAFQCYSNSRFIEASKLFEHILAHQATDYPSQVLLDRCRAYLTNPPAPNWNGAFILSSK